jgi:hypothetical protein
MLDPATQADLARRTVDTFRRLGIEVILVGSTSALATGVLQKTSKDVDVLAPASAGKGGWDMLLAAAARAMGAALEERGWGVKSLVKRGEEGEELWAVDVLIPDVGPIPEQAARLVRKRAVKTDLGLAAIPEHVLAMKAVAWGDCLGQGDAGAALVYEADLTDLGEALGKGLDMDLVAELLKRFADARADQGRYILKRVLGAGLGRSHGRDVA